MLIPKETLKTAYESLGFTQTDDDGSMLTFRRDEDALSMFHSYLNGSGLLEEHFVLEDASLWDGELGAQLAKLLPSGAAPVEDEEQGLTTDEVVGNLEGEMQAVLGLLAAVLQVLSPEQKRDIAQSLGVNINDFKQVYDRLTAGAPLNNVNKAIQDGFMDISNMFLLGLEGEKD